MKSRGWLYDFFIGIILAVMVSMYLFPIGFRGLPESMNVKQLMAVLGIVVYVFRCIKNKDFSFTRTTIISGLLAIIFSVWCLGSVVANNTEEYGYALYIRAFAIWYFGAYALIAMLKARYGKVDLPLITKYLAIVCVAQCVLAQIIDNVPSFKLFVDTWIVQDRVPILVDRLYGIGASLDSAGVRYCFVQILMAHQISTNKSVFDNRKTLSLYIIALLVIAVLGNMMARTTTIGTILALFYVFIKYGIARGGEITSRQFRIITTLTFIIVTVAAISTYLYNTNPQLRAYFRFAFEAFFNLFEKGELTTGSTEKLNTEMWIWPHDAHGWWIGYGIFERRDFGLTDIGYCRFALYCGIPGIIIFSLYFIYNASTVVGKFKNSKILALLLLSLTFIIWIKVSTDIFQVYALLFCIAGDFDEDGNEIEPEIDETESEDLDTCSDI